MERTVVGKELSSLSKNVEMVKNLENDRKKWKLPSRKFYVRLNTGNGFLVSVKNVSSRSLPNTLNIKIFKNVILPLVFYGFDLQIEGRIQIGDDWEKRAGKIIGPKRGWKSLFNIKSCKCIDTYSRRCWEYNKPSRIIDFMKLIVTIGPMVFRILLLVAFVRLCSTTH